MKNVINKIITLIILPLFITSILVFVFFAGGLSDRLFYIKPLDYVYKRTNENLNQNFNPYNNSSEDIANVAEKASDSVITVSIKSLPIRQRSLLDDLFGLNMFGFRQENLQPNNQNEITRDIGSGFVVEGGLVITNKHVVEDKASTYKVIDNTDKEYEVENIYRDPLNDLAILKVKDLNLEGLPLGDSDKLRVGQKVIAIGTALGEFRHTVTTGVVSGLSRGIVAEGSLGGVEEIENVIQTDAAINPGNSGGPLIDMMGNVIGINVAVSRGAENVGFALPINILKDSLDNFNSSGQFDRPYLGVRYQMISKKAALANEVPAGAYVTEIIENSPAAKSELKIEDIITEFDGQTLDETNENSLVGKINKKKIGDTVKLKIYRWSENKTMEISVTLEKLQN